MPVEKLGKHPTDETGLKLALAAQSMGPPAPHAATHRAGGADDLLSAPGAIGGGTPGAITGTTITSTSGFAGPGAGLTGLPAAQLTGTLAYPLFTNPVSKKYTAVGANGTPNHVAAVGAKVGDLVIAVIGINTSTGAVVALDGSALFESQISVNDQIQQASNTNLTPYTYLFLVQPRS